MKKKDTYQIEKISLIKGWKLPVHTLLVIGGFSLVSLFAIWWFSPSHIPNNFGSKFLALDIFLFILLTFVVWHQIMLECFLWYVSCFMKHPKPIAPVPGLRVGFLTAFVPGKEPYEILENTLRAMVSAEYPHDTWVLDEGNDVEVKEICKRVGAYHFSRKGIEKYNQAEGLFKAKTKGGNYNAWFDKYGEGYDIVAQHDVDFVPKKDFLTKTLGYFRDEEVAFVGTPQVYGNQKESWIAEGAAEQAYGFYGPMQKGFFGMDMQLLIGSNHIMRVSAHHSIGNYAGHIVEDHLTGMKFYAKKWKSVYVPEALAIGEGPSTWDAYFSQQMRWAYGLMDIFFRHSPGILPKMKLKHFFNYFVLQQYYFIGLAQAIGMFLLGLYFFFGIHATEMELLPLLFLYVPVLVYQLVMFFWLQVFNIDPKKEWGFYIRGKILGVAAWPIYFLAFMKSLSGRKLVYAVTPKGETQGELVYPGLFTPHFISGSATLAGMIIGYLTGRFAPQLVFWAVLNTVFMYSFWSGSAFPYAKNRTGEFLRNLKFSPKFNIW